VTDREKVIKELEILRDICNAKSNMAIGKGKVAWAGYANAADDALSMLKELQPRVLSYDEMKTMIGKPVYVEEPKRNADPHCRWGLVVEGEEPPEEGGYNYPGGVDFNVEVSLDTYDGDLYMVDIGCGWRAWTAEPTDDQRMNTPWKGR
jgi:hypothetical protein